MAKPRPQGPCFSRPDMTTGAEGPLCPGSPTAGLWVRQGVCSGICVWGPDGFAPQTCTPTMSSAIVLRCCCPPAECIARSRVQLLPLEEHSSGRTALLLAALCCAVRRLFGSSPRCTAQRCGIWMSSCTTCTTPMNWGSRRCWTLPPSARGLPGGVRGERWVHETLSEGERGQPGAQNCSLQPGPCDIRRGICLSHKGAGSAEEHGTPDPVGYPSSALRSPTQALACCRSVYSLVKQIQQLHAVSGTIASQNLDSKVRCCLCPSSHRVPMS